MSEPKELRQFVELVINDNPELNVLLDAPADLDGSWWVDVYLDETVIRGVWSPRSGFGIFATEAEHYGDQPDEMYYSAVLAARRVSQIVKKLRASLQRGMTPSDLREFVGLTQIELALRLGTQQAAVSKAERRATVQFDTMDRFLVALGGKLELRARFEEFDVVILPDNVTGTRKVAREVREGRKRSA
jgi:hypothetical protein